MRNHECFLGTMNLQQVEYESLPTIYFECDQYGHVQDLCPSKNGSHGGHWSE